MATDLLFRDDAYLRDASATVVGVNDRRGIVLDRTVFYATGGGLFFIVQSILLTCRARRQRRAGGRAY